MKEMKVSVQASFVAVGQICLVMFVSGSRGLLCPSPSAFLFYLHPRTWPRPHNKKAGHGEVILKFKVISVILIR